MEEVLEKKEVVGKNIEVKDDNLAAREDLVGKSLSHEELQQLAETRFVAQKKAEQIPADKIPADKKEKFGFFKKVFAKLNSGADNETVRIVSKNHIKQAQYVKLLSIDTDQAEKYRKALNTLNTPFWDSENKKYIEARDARSLRGDYKAKLESLMASDPDQGAKFKQAIEEKDMIQPTWNPVARVYEEKGRLTAAVGESKM